MALLIDLFGYLSVVLHGFTIAAQSMTLGGVVFLLLLARPFAALLGDTGAAILRRTWRMAAWSAVALVVFESATVALQLAVLVGTTELPLAEVADASFAVAGMIKIVAAIGIGALCFRRPIGWVVVPVLVGLILLTLVGSAATTHAAARLDDRAMLLVISALHQLGAAVWIGGIPYFVMALARSGDGTAWRRIGKRFSQMSMAGVLLIGCSGIGMSIAYIGSIAAIYGTAYGVMVSAKVAMFLGLLFLGGMNYLLVERLRRDASTPVWRLKRFAEVEIGIGFTVFFAAASLTSVPPGVDLTNDRVTFHEIVERNTPRWPDLASPDYDGLAIPHLQAQLDAEAAKEKTAAPPAFIPGSGYLPPRNAEDIAWSEYNHHWSGILVLAIGLCALLDRTGWVPIARHWPLLFLALALFLFLRSDPEVWPLGEIGFFDSLRDIEVVQHRIFVTLIIGFGIFEWMVRTGRLTSPTPPLVFPLITAVGAALLLTHTHAISNVKDQLLIELTHTPLALAGVTAGWARWLELRIPQNRASVPGWIWPVCFVFIGLLLLSYREA
ncbi:MAG TPA: CopD family protein [Stellaceae bacterium]|nr:CopD family protein [Stellaceae bacterium]